MLGEYAFVVVNQQERIHIYKGSAWVPAGTHAPDREIYLRAKWCDYLQAGWYKCTIWSRYEQDQGNTKWHREKAMPSDSSQCLYLSPWNLRPAFIYRFFGTLLLLSFSVIYSEIQ